MQFDMRLVAFVFQAMNWRKINCTITFCRRNVNFREDCSNTIRWWLVFDEIYSFFAQSNWEIINDAPRTPIPCCYAIWHARVWKPSPSLVFARVEWVFKLHGILFKWTRVRVRTRVIFAKTFEIAGILRRLL